MNHASGRVSEHIPIRTGKGGGGHDEDGESISTAAILEFPVPLESQPTVVAYPKLRSNNRPPGIGSAWPALALLFSFAESIVYAQARYPRRKIKQGYGVVGMRSTAVIDFHFDSQHRMLTTEEDARFRFRCPW
ncbi:hypothetical protein LX36DRAFT_650384 [Colletotrichum falcatum]|nr:hypothetical protein LX36DRAFT_650384 [Colletotrichum falcatum]